MAAASFMSGSSPIRECYCRSEQFDKSSQFDVFNLKVYSKTHTASIFSMIGKIVAHSSKVYTMASFSETSYSNKNILKTVLFSSEFFHKQRAMSICCLTQTIG